MPLRAPAVPEGLRRLAVRHLRRPLQRARWAGREAALRWQSRDATAPPDARTSELVVVSPHLDDAVLSCTGLLSTRPGARVVTAYTAGPPVWEGVTEWDDECGFRPGVDVMAIRKQEDLAALALVGAEPVWLDLVEGQYEPRPGPTEVTDRLRRGLSALAPAPTVVAIPLGVDHPDHVTASEALLALRAEGLLSDATWLLYGDLPYTARSPEIAAARLATLRQRGLVLEEHPRPPVDLARKRAAVGRYRTQIRPLWGSLPVLPGQEALWRLA